MSKLSNTLTMLQLLSSGRKYSIKELSETLEVTPRMIRVYKEDLEKAGIFIDTIMGPYGGYVLKQEIRIDTNKYKIKLTPEDQNKYNILTRGIKEKRKVKILYVSKSNGLNYRVIEPAEMFLFKDGWYCVAYCELREDMRQFGLKDIKEIELLNDTF
jgi:predicted DNA-binding transcriptional regulator YafY